MHIHLTVPITVHTAKKRKLELLPLIQDIPRPSYDASLLGRFLKPGGIQVPLLTGQSALIQPLFLCESAHLSLAVATATELQDVPWNSPFCRRPKRAWIDLVRTVTINASSILAALGDQLEVAFCVRLQHARI